MMISKLSELIVNTNNFNQSVESDYYLGKILNQILQQILNGVVTSDLLLFVD